MLLLQGHEGIVPMVGLGFGLAMLPDAVIDSSPMNNQISRLNLDKPIEPFELGICTQKKKSRTAPSPCILGDVRIE